MLSLPTATILLPQIHRIGVVIMPFFEDIGKKISNMSQSAVEKTKCSTETLRLNNQIREEQRFCKDLYQQSGQQYAK